MRYGQIWLENKTYNKQKSDTGEKYLLYRTLFFLLKK